MHKLPTFKICAQKAQVNHDTATACYNGKIENGKYKLPVTLSLAKECQDSANSNMKCILADLQENGVTPLLSQAVATIYGVNELDADSLLCALSTIDSNTPIERLFFGTNKRYPFFASFEARGYTWLLSCPHLEPATLDWCGVKWEGDLEEISNIVSCIKQLRT